jgi:dUTP pyrophosphatase
VARGFLARAQPTILVSRRVTRLVAARARQGSARNTVRHVPPDTDDLTPGHGLPVAVVRLDAGLPLPSYAHPGDAGADLMSTVDLTLAPGERALVPTGIALALPEGYVALVHPRSGLAARHGLSIVNTPGTIDAGYRGEIKVLLVNHDRTQPVELRRGDRIAQLVVQRFERAVFTEVAALPDSVRGAGGYGSTGVESPAPGA